MVKIIPYSEGLNYRALSGVTRHNGRFGRTATVY